MEVYSNRELFLNDLKELENSLSSVAELVTQPDKFDSLDSSTIQFKITENVKKKYCNIINNYKILNNNKIHFIGWIP